MGSWLSGWLFNPTLALGGAAIAVPILIHLLSRRRVRKLRWAAMDFLLAAYRRNRRRVRIEQFIILALRCLIVLLLALMMARPFLRPGTAAALIGSAPRTERVVVLDDSYSMGYRTGPGQTVFKMGCAAVEQLVRWAAAEFPGDSVTLIRTSDPLHAAAAVPSLSMENVLRIRDGLARLSASDGPARPGAALRAAADLVDRSGSQANAAVYIVSDFQRRDWIIEGGSSAAAGRPASIIAPLAAATSRRGVRLTLVDIGADRPSNVAVSAVAATTPQTVAGVRSRFELSVTNHSDSPASDLELRVSIEDQAMTPVLLPRIAARQTWKEPVEVTFPREGSDRIVAELGGSAARDRLPLDNRRALGVEVGTGVRVLAVDGEPSHEGFRDEVYLLRTALNPSGRVASGNDVHVIEPERLDEEDLRPYHVVILANVYRVDETVQRRLEEFVRDGGGLAIFLGRQVDAVAYNERLFAGGRGLLPAELGDPQTASGTGEGVGLGEWDAVHPLFRGFVGAGSGLMRGVRVYAFVASRPAAVTEEAPTTRAAPTSAAGGEAAGSGPGAPTSRPAATVLATLDDAEHSPLLIERPYGAGKVILCTTTADLDWSGWARDPSYVPTMLQMMQYLARLAEFAGQVEVGESIVLPVDPASFLAKGSVRLPSHLEEPPFEIEARPDSRGGLRFVWDRTERAGVYRFELQRPTRERVSRFVSVNPDPGEGDLTRASPEELRAALHEMHFDYIRDLSALSGEGVEARRELWWPLLLVVVGLLAAEQALARWFGARG